MTTQAKHRRTGARASQLEEPSIAMPTPRNASLRPPRLMHEAIARRAYELFLERGGSHGHDQEDWFRATQELYQDTALGMADDAAPEQSATPIGKPHEVHHA